MVDERGRSVAEIAGDLFYERRRSVGDAAADRRGHPTGAEAIPRRAEREAFWKSFITPETEQRMLAEGMAAGAPPHELRKAISGIKYKRRWELFERQGELPDRIAWAKEMVKLGPPEAEVVQASAETGGAPAPAAASAAVPAMGPNATAAGAGLLDAAVAVPGPAAAALMGAAKASEGGIPYD